MMSFEIAGAITVIALVGLGIFVYPWLLTKRGGAWWIALSTAVLATAFYVFGRGPSSETTAALLGLLWAVLPVIAGVITRRVNRALGKP
jgi:hypothetical protein